MGLWDWFRPSPPPPAPQIDRVWLTKTAKLAGLAAEVSAAAGPVLVLAHFPQTLRETREALAAVGFPGEDVEGPLTVRALLNRPRVTDGPIPLFALVSQLRPADPPTDPADVSSARILVAERHFLRSRDDEVLRFAAGLGRPLVTFFLSLDEPLLAAFGPWLTGILQKLGMKETDAIESPMVLRRVRQAQAWYERRVEGDRPADSAEEWLAHSGAG